MRTLSAKKVCGDKQNLASFDPLHQEIDLIFAHHFNRLKCNRSHPCENCVKRGDATSCTYAQTGSRKKNTPSQSASNSPDDMQNRIDRLENLVLSLMTNGSQTAGPAAAAAALSGNDSIGSAQNYQDIDLDDDGDVDESDTEAVTKSFGIMKVDNNKSMYISEAHWASVLNDVSWKMYGELFSGLFLTLLTDRRSSSALCEFEEAIRGASGENKCYKTNRYDYDVTVWLGNSPEQSRNSFFFALEIFNRYSGSSLLCKSQSRNL